MPSRSEALCILFVGVNLSACREHQARGWGRGRQRVQGRQWHRNSYPREARAGRGVGQRSDRIGRVARRPRWPRGGQAGTRAAAAGGLKRLSSKLRVSALSSVRPVRRSSKGNLWTLPRPGNRVRLSLSRGLPVRASSRNGGSLAGRVRLASTRLARKRRIPAPSWMRPVRRRSKPSTRAAAKRWGKRGQHWAHCQDESRQAHDDCPATWGELARDISPSVEVGT